MNNSNQARQFGNRWSIRYGGLILILFGGAAASAIFPTLQRAAVEQSWVETVCTIESSQLNTDEYATSNLALVYRYKANDKQLRGTAYETKSNINRSTAFYRSALEDLNPGVDVPCYFDPAHPETVVIRRTEYSDGAAIFVPALFIALGSCLVWLQYRSRNAS